MKKKTGQYQKRKGYFKEYYKKNPDVQRAANLKFQFGITLEEYDRMYAAQDGRCAICGGTNESGRRLAVDHDHSTGRVRALLCTNCNHGLGKFKENQALMEKAIQYLKTFQ